MKDIIITKPIRVLLLLLFIPLWVSAQTISVKGVVKDTKGDALIGVSVVEQGTSNGIVTDLDGQYTLNVSSKAKLNFSYLGYLTQTVEVRGKTKIDITLQEDTKALDQVVVIGYGTARRSDVTGAISSINDKSLKEIPSANITQALQGRLPGITISQTTTRPGQAGQIRIRGSRSLNASNDPLIVLDGIPFEGSMNDINPGDIRSIDVLKDASATAVYGSRGANGVILISTYRGQEGAPKIMYNGFAGVKTVSKKYEVFNSPEFQTLREIAGAFTNMPQEQAMIDAGLSTDWQDLMYKDGFMTQHDINISGGTSAAQYSWGGTYYNETTVLPGQDFTRYALRTTLDQEIGKHLKVGISSQNSYGVTNGESASFMYQLITLTPIAPAYNDDGSIFIQPVYPNDNYYNPLLVNNKDSWSQRRKRFSSFNSVYGEIKFTSDLKYRINLGLSYRQDNYGHFYGSETPFRNGEISQAQVTNGIATTWAIENLLYYDKVFKEKHKLNLVAMFSSQDTESNTSSMTATDLVADYMQYYNLGYYNTENGEISIPASSQNYYKTGLLSYMFRANYSYDNKYMLTLTGRMDGSSVLATGSKWHTYPAISAGWNISNEDWAKKYSWLSMLKIRAGYGQTANQAVNAYSTLGALSQNKYNYGDQFAYGYYVSSLANSNLGWEYTDTYNVGLDFTLFNERISGTVEWYTQHTHDLLLSQSLPSTTGVPGSIMRNVGETKNKGMEFSLSGKIIETKDFSWALDANIYYNRNKIVKLNGVDRDEANGWFVGEPIDVIYDYNKIGIWQLNEADEAAKFGFTPGQVKIEDYNNDGKISADDRHIIGKFDPDFEGGFTSRMTYKGFDLTAVAFYRVGGTLISTIHQGQSYLNMLQGRRNQIKVDYWTPTNPTNKFPMPNASDQPTNSVFGGTLGYYDAGFLKIRSITLGYTIPANWMQEHLGVRYARVYFTAQNPFTLFSDYMKEGGVDPEATGSGNQGQGYSGTIQSRQLTIGLNTPPTRNFLVGLNLNF